MKESKGVYVTKRDIRENLHRDHQWYANNNIVNAIEVNNYKLTNDVGIQYNSKRDNIFYNTHRNVSTIRRYHDHDLRYFNPIPKQIFRHTKSKSFTDIGVGSVKALQKKKVKRIYLPETDDRGVGSSDLSSFISRMQSAQNKSKAYSNSLSADKAAKQYISGQSYYESKKTSSKCVGEAIEYRPECLVSVKVSPIIHTKSGSTSPKESKHIEIGTVKTEKQFVTIDTQFEEPEKEEKATPEMVNQVFEETVAAKDKIIVVADKSSKYSQESSNVEIMNEMAKTQKHYTEAKVAAVKVTSPKIESSEVRIEITLPENKSERLHPNGSFSSDSLVQHVYNLEQPSDNSKRRDPMENKMEREYRKIFGSASKDQKPEAGTEKQQVTQKSTSLFRRRFTAIKKSLGKKESKNYDPTQATFSSVKDASVTSDLPSLLEISVSGITGYSTSKRKAHGKTSYKKSYIGNKFSKPLPKVVNPIDSEYNQGVKGMFKLWGKKFNLDDSSDAKDENITQPSSFEKPKTEDEQIEKEKAKIIVEKMPELNVEEKVPDKRKLKKEKKFLFFKKKQRKDKEKNQNSTYKNKKGITTGRCEVNDGLSLRIGGGPRPPSSAKSKTPPPPVRVIKERALPLKPHDELDKTAWLVKFLSHQIESRNSVKVRWNNRTYTTSSSTVFELIENVYKDSGAVLNSKSEITGDTSSNWSYFHPNVNFAQKVEAWVMPTTELDHETPKMPKKKCNKNPVSKLGSDSNNITVSTVKVKQMSNAFARNIEVVLHSKIFGRPHRPQTSADFLRIDIPKGFFSDTSCDYTQQGHSSAEEVYNIVEYESGNCGPPAKCTDKRLKELHSGDNIYVTVSVKSEIGEEKQIMETVTERPAASRDVVIQGSNVYVAKMCDDIGLGIVTQLDVRDVGKPKLVSTLEGNEFGSLKVS